MSEPSLITTTNTKKTSITTNQHYQDSEIAKLLILESQTYSQDPYHSNRDPFSTGRSLKTNKRFLKSVIRNVNDHNRQLERKPEVSLGLNQEIKRDEIKDRHRHKDHQHYQSSRLEEEVDISIKRYYSKKSSGTISRSHDVINHREKGIKFRDRKIHSDDDDDKVKKYSDESTGSFIKQKSYKRERSNRTRDQDKDSRYYEHRRATKQDSSKNKAKDDEGKKEDSTTSQHDHQPLPSTSKMDKYFSSTYDPRLDVNLDDMTDPTTGLIQDGNYDDWEAILAELKAKREAKSRAKEAQLEKKLIQAQRKLRKAKRREEKKRDSHRSKKKSSRKQEEETHQDEEGSDTRSFQKKLKRESKKEGYDKKRHKDSFNGCSKSSHRRKDDEDESETEANRKTSKRKRRQKDLSSSSDSSDYSSDEDSSSANNTSKNHNQNIGLMQIKGYAKQGKQREWDLGKPSPT